ncbi:PREDICTED: uncharacterized protein LOC104803350 [Tarenaya hassleriana]|uniref:uncharacterized protein LOC104803350 n=1 Tax=Tarenaya hassleriana TaxID=28532 RepID=UPI00053C3179|nr:PREDICTED: uncharacterized protein LOC104803350 [Tarenaya hassleriana]
MSSSSQLDPMTSESDARHTKKVRMRDEEEAPFHSNAWTSGGVSFRDKSLLTESRSPEKLSGSEAPGNSDQLQIDVLKTREPMEASGDPKYIQQLSCIRRPDIDRNNFEFQLEFINMLSSSAFRGRTNEDPIPHLTRFKLLCKSVMTVRGVTDESLMLMAFPFSLMDTALEWLYILPPDSIFSWEQQRFFPASKTQLAKQQINSFLQELDESLCEAWDRFQGYQRTCPHHGWDKRYLISTFLQGLKEDIRVLIRVVCGGSLNEKSFDFIEQQINKMTNECAPSHEFIRNVSLKDSRAGKESLSKIQALRSELAKLKIQVENAHQISDLDTSANGYMIEDIYYIDNNLYSNVSNSGWRNHPNFSYKNSSNILNTPHGNFSGPSNQGLSQEHQPRSRALPQHQNQAVQHYLAPLQSHQKNAPSPPPPQVDFDLDLKSIFAQLMQAQEVIRTEMREHQQKTDAHFKLVDNQIAQLAASIPSRPQGSLPGKPETNLREHCNAVFLRSGKQLGDVFPSTPEKGEYSNSRSAITSNIQFADTSIKMTCEEEPKYVFPYPRPPPVPFPSRLVQHKEASQFKRFTDMIKQLEVTMPFHEVITQMPSYAKFLKDILARKKTMEKETVALTKECSAVFQHDLPRKMADPGSFFIPCKMGNLFIEQALCDLGASVSLMPLSIFKRLDVGELKPTQMILHLADSSTKRPAGILEDMPLKVGNYYIPVDFVVLDMDADSSMPIKRLDVGELKPTQMILHLADSSTKRPAGILEDMPLKVGNYYIPVDFVVLDMDADSSMPIILGRPFLNTADVIIHVRAGRLTMSIGDETI